jgi:hypothetical protein
MWIVWLVCNVIRSRQVLNKLWRRRVLQNGNVFGKLNLQLSDWEIFADQEKIEFP